MRSQRIKTEQVETPDELENVHMEMYFEGYHLVKGNLGFFLANYDRDFSEIEKDEKNLKAMYSSVEVEGQPWIEFTLEYTGDFGDLEDYYSEVIPARNIQ